MKLGSSIPKVRTASRLKSLRSVKFSLFCSAKAFWAKGLSTLTARTWAFISLNFAMPSRNVHNSFVQTPVNAPGKKASTVGLPRNSESFTALRSLLTRVTSGTRLPTSTAMRHLHAK